MPRSWLPSDERQYSAIVDSCEGRGRYSMKRCKSMAAATVNKRRAREGRTLSGIPVLTEKQSKARVKALRARGCKVTVTRRGSDTIIYKKCPSGLSGLVYREGRTPTELDKWLTLGLPVGGLLALLLFSKDE